MDNIKMWTGLPVEESIKMTEDRDKWRKYIHGVTNLRSRMAKEQNRSVPISGMFSITVCYQTYDFAKTLVSNFCFKVNTLDLSD